MENKFEEARGIECPRCHKERFQFLVRNGVKICIICVKEIDAEEAIKKGRKYKTIAERREASFLWADRLDGKAVYIGWPPTHYRRGFAYFLDSYFNVRFVRGTAYRCASVWGKIKVTIDPSESRKIALKSWPEFPNQKPILFINDEPCGQDKIHLDSIEDGTYCAIVRWRYRRFIIEVKKDDSTPS